MKLIFLLEEPSMKYFLDGLLPRILPDEIVNPKQELMKLLPEHQQIAGAKKMAPIFNIEGNESISFQMFVKGVKKLIGE